LPDRDLYIATNRALKFVVVVGGGEVKVTWSNFKPGLKLSDTSLQGTLSSTVGP